MANSPYPDKKVQIVEGDRLHELTVVGVVADPSFGIAYVPIGVALQILQQPGPVSAMAKIRQRRCWPEPAGQTRQIPLHTKSQRREVYLSHGLVAGPMFITPDETKQKPAEDR